MGCLSNSNDDSWKSLIGFSLICKPEKIFRSYFKSLFLRMIFNQNVQSGNQNQSFLCLIVPCWWHWCHSCRTIRAYAKLRVPAQQAHNGAQKNWSKWFNESNNEFRISFQIIYNQFCIVFQTLRNVLNIFESFIFSKIWIVRYMKTETEECKCDFKQDQT